MTRVVILDVETTGKDVSRDQIVEISIQLGLGEIAECRGWRIKPTVEIHPEAQKVHGISAADVANCPTFREVALEVVGLLGVAEVIVGYNVAFDLDILNAELARVALPPIDTAAKLVVDVLRLWHHVEPRTLVAAHEKFVGEPLTNAHAASVDVAATGRVLRAMLDRFGLAGRAWPELAAIANPFEKRANWIGPSHHFQWDCGHAVVAFGKHAGIRIDRVDPGFLSWILTKDFPAHVKEICHVALRNRPEQIEALIAQRYPRPSQQEAA